MLKRYDDKDGGGKAVVLASRAQSAGNQMQETITSGSTLQVVRAPRRSGSYRASIGTPSHAVIRSNPTVTPQRQDTPPSEVPETDVDTDLDLTDSTDDEDDYVGPLSFSLVSTQSPSVTSTDTGDTSASDDEDDVEQLANLNALSASLGLPRTSTLTRAHTMPAAVGRASTPSSPTIVETKSSCTTPHKPAVLTRAKSDDHESARQPPSQPSTPSKAKETPEPTGPVLKKSDDGFFLIAHDQILQEVMDNYRLPWGVQYELARGVTKGLWTWEAVDSKIRQLKASVNKDAILAPSFVFDIMLGREPVVRQVKLWEELNREQLALMENDSRGLGLKGDWQGEPNWYGGKIQQIVRLVPRERKPGADKKQQPVYHLQLEAMEMGRSHRFARFLGSRRLLQMRVPKSYDVDVTKLKDLLLQKFVICGRVFVSFAVKDRKLHLVETDEDFQREPQVHEGDVHRMSLEKLVEWYNPMSLNHKQKINKWTTRFDLGLSTSIPILKFEPENIEVIEDWCAPHKEDSAPTNKIYTDGCGFMNASGLLAISRQLGFIERTTAVQGRVLGSKGVWALHPEHLSLDEPPRIWIRRSQQKIHLVDPKKFGPSSLKDLSPAHLIFDLVAPARVWTPSRLSKSTIINFDHNQVPKDVIIKLMEDGLRQEIEPLTKWKIPNAMPLLWNAVDKVSGVTPQRVERVANGIERASGLSKRRDHDNDGDNINENDGDDDPAAAALDTPPYTIGESVMDRLQSGFSPLEDEKLHADLRTLVKETMKKAVLEFHITIAASAEAFIIPDPTGLLKPHQIHFTSTKYLKDPLVDVDARTIIGDCLIYRNPARVASDVQKVTAVHLPELSQYVDVIVVPVQGEESLPSMLAGGDVDGDTAVCIWNEELVQSFVQPPMVREPEGLMDNFEPLDAVPSVKSVTELMEKDTDSEMVLRKHLLTGLSDSRTGLYSMFHENTIWQYGYNHPNTIRNAFMFTTILDSRKSGLVLREDVFVQDRKRDGGGLPECFGGSGDGVKKRLVKEPFILDELRREGDKIQNDLLKQYDEIVKTSYKLDKDLTRPWEESSELDYPVIKEELERIKSHVDECNREWGSMWRRVFASNNFQTESSKAQQEAKRKAENGQKTALARQFASGPPDCPILTVMGMVDTLRASYAYKKSHKFAWAFAFQALCKIKAEKGGTKAFTKEFAQMMTLPSAAVRVMSQDHTAAE